MAEAKRENLISAADAAREFLGVEGLALTALVTAREAASREFLSATTPLAETLRNMVVGSWQGYLTALNAAASTRDASLDTSLTSLTGTILTAEESYSAAILSAGRRHDQAVVSAAAARDAALLDAMDAALDRSGNGTGLAFTAAEAQPIREAVARLRGVVGASATVASAAVDATATFLSQLANHGTALSQALNAADSVFFNAVLAAETAALDAAFVLRANYERAVISADSAYASALATGSGEAFQNLATAIESAKSAHVDDLVERESPEFAASAQHAPTWDADGRGSVFVDQYTLSLDGLLDQIAAWDAAHPVTNPPPVTAPPLDLGLPTTPPAWMTLFVDAFGQLPDIPPSENSSSGSGGATTGNGSTTGGGSGTNPGGSNSSSAVPPLPGWFAQLGNLVARGAQVIAAAPASTPPASLPQDPGPLETIASVEWTTLCHVQSGVFVASFDENSGPAVRVVDGRILAVDFSAAKAMAASESARNWTIADWDGWFAVRGNDAPLSPASLAALQTALNVAVGAFGPGIHLNGETPFDPSLDDQQSLMSQKERIDAIVSEGAYCPQIYDVVSYAELVAHARASLQSPTATPGSTAIADAFIADYGYSGLLRLYRMEREGRWNVAIRDLSPQRDIVQGQGFATVFGDGPDHHVPEGTARLYVNDRQTRGPLVAPTERAALADPHVIAARVHAALYATGVSIHNAGVQTESTAAAAWQAFLADPKLRISFGVVEMASAYATIPATFGASSAPAIYVGLRGFDEVLAGIRQLCTGDPNTRAYANLALDYVTGDEALSNGIVMFTDFAANIASVKIAATEAAAKATQKTTEVLSRAGAVTDNVAGSASSMIKTSTVSAARATGPEILSAIQHGGLSTPIPGWFTRLKFRWQHRAVISELSSGTDVPVDAFLKSRTRQAVFGTIGEITAATGNEVALLRTETGLILRMGNQSKVSVAGARRVIAHSHPDGRLGLSSDDFVHIFMSRQQGSTIVIGPSGHWRRYTSSQNVLGGSL